MEPIDVLRTFIGKEFSASPSPFMKWLNPVVLAVESGALEFAYTIRAEWLNPMGNLHGGVSAAIVDDSLGATVYSLGEPFYYTTINNAIDYFSVAREGDTIIARTAIVKKGKQFIHAQCEIWNADRSRMIAKGTSNLFKTILEKSKAAPVP